MIESSFLGEDLNSCALFDLLLGRRYLILLRASLLPPSSLFFSPVGFSLSPILFPCLRLRIQQVAEA